MTRTWVEKVAADPERMKAYQQERLILDVTELISRRMEEHGVSRAELAKRLGRSKGYITQLLDGRANMTLRTVSDVMLALGRTMTVADKPLRVSAAASTSAPSSRGESPSAANVPRTARAVRVAAGRSRPVS
jgi:transcriptional regulator with XRE-family HTH domain